jgi:CMP/dCMP kinase
LVAKGRNSHQHQKYDSFLASKPLNNPLLLIPIMIILVSGMPGAGKSAVADLLAEKLSYSRKSTGSMQRELAQEQGMTITQWGEVEKTDPKYDLMIDNKIKEVLEKEDNLVIDTWIGPHFAKPDAIKIFLDCEEMERARRRVCQKRCTEAFDKIEDVIKDMRQRVQTNRERWIKFYNYDFLDKSIYDMILDTTNLTVPQVVEQIMGYINDVYGPVAQKAQKGTKTRKK